MRLPHSSSLLRRGQLASVHSHLGFSGVRSHSTAVLGGGITGLTAAWQLIQDPKCEQVVLYEKSNRLGGWVDSETIPVEDGNVVFEYGPRTLKSSLPSSLPLLYLATNLGLYKDLIITPKSSPAARNRYIYYPDHLVRMPAPEPKLTPLEFIKKTLNTIWNEPVFDKFLAGLLHDIYTQPRHATEWAKDESVADFIGRRFHPKVADNLVSAVYHGIYAGDIDQLSAQMLMGSIRDLEGGTGGVGSFVPGGIFSSMISRAFSRKRTHAIDDYLAVDAISGSPELSKYQHELEGIVAGASTFTFKNGVGQLIDALVASLKNSGKVKIVTNSKLERLTLDSVYGIHVKTPSVNGNGLQTQKFNHVISTIPPASLANILLPAEGVSKEYEGRTRNLLQKQNYAVTVMVVNLYYPNPDLLPVEDGFGYLIPRSIPYDQNPECGLGVIFASASSVGNSPHPTKSTVNQDTAPGTKLTVMMGGHYWDGMDKYPDHDTAVKMARDMLKRHLNITDTPTVARTRLQKDAIPQYTVGHLQRMYDLSYATRVEYRELLTLAGNWYNGVGVSDCVKQGILSATYGTGRVIPNTTHGPWRPWNGVVDPKWDYQGGIAMSPVRFTDSRL
ncbi:hypothetical protein PENANT_c029G02616 [Penicillium antarcticum]|uniref:Protoporphyrinogen oxidase n=1 Tax=Penicillium antarcticum TaxID=416450 RepID=A0A1V6PW07_9EURO|nr:uncharacterized protein N7508_001615 [Penicillium antarcticum]KAJ5317107.1 hypothetical protein N7508_001615 [Penicillium antarcticum]OQD81190.1 hypothetical protein PENANT_c029G02616 [Penicillium antarcticum]